MSLAEPPVEVPPVVTPALVVPPPAVPVPEEVSVGVELLHAARRTRPTKQHGRAIVEKLVTFHAKGSPLVNASLRIRIEAWLVAQGESLGPAATDAPPAAPMEGLARHPA
jgi:hypothetical protein